MINFKSYKDLYNDTMSWSKVLPFDFDAILGIPRSGHLLACMLGLHRNVFTGDVFSLLHNDFNHGHTRSLARSDIKKILVVDDSVNKGTTLAQYKDLINKSLSVKNYQICYGALYVTSKSKNLVDFSFQVLEQPRVFFWNVFHNAYMSRSCVDIDGVLCEDPTHEQNDDGEKYVEFLKNATPVFLPTTEVHTLVTARLEKYRSLTFEWLKKHRVRFKNLIMSPHKTRQERKEASDYAMRKAAAYKEATDTILFVESNYSQANKIHNLTMKPVLSIERMVMIGG